MKEFPSVAEVLQDTYGLTNPDLLTYFNDCSPEKAVILAYYYDTSPEYWETLFLLSLQK